MVLTITNRSQHGTLNGTSTDTITAFSQSSSGWNIPDSAKPIATKHALEVLGGEDTEQSAT